jgi:DnaJ like chaperone protein
VIRECDIDLQIAGQRAGADTIAGRLSQRMWRASSSMAWRGKAIGASVGVLAGGPVGALVGLFLGHLVDAAQSPEANGAQGAADPPADLVQEALFRATFQVMGHIAKADGRVTEAEIHAARAAMKQMRLSERQMEAAIDHYRAGKDPDFPIERTLRELLGICGERPDLRRMFMQIQLQTALAGGDLNGATRRAVSRVARALEVSSYEMVQIEALLRLQRATQDVQPAAPGDHVTQAYDVLGIARDASDEEVTRAYRRLMNRNHPDKLHAQRSADGAVPEAVLKQAEEKTRRIRAAYEQIRDARGMK